MWFPAVRGNMSYPFITGFLSKIGREEEYTKFNTFTTVQCILYKFICFGINHNKRIRTILQSVQSLIATFASQPWTQEWQRWHWFHSSPSKDELNWSPHKQQRVSDRTFSSFRFMHFSALSDWILELRLTFRICLISLLACNVLSTSRFGLNVRMEAFSVFPTDFVFLRLDFSNSQIEEGETLKQPSLVLVKTDTVASDNSKSSVP